MRYFKSKIKLLVVAFALIVTSCSDNKYTLEYKLQKGESFKQFIETNMKLNQDAGMQKINISVLTSMTINLEVKDFQNDLYDNVITFERMKVDMDMGAMKMSIDSDTPDSIATLENLSPLFKAITQVPIEIKVDKQGKIQSAQGFDKMLESMKNSFDNSIDEITKNQIIGQFGEQFASEGILSQISSNLPKNHVGIGDSWDVNMDIKTGQTSINANLKFKLIKVEGNLAIIETTGTIATPEGGVVQDMQGMEAKTTLSGEQTGTIKIDMNTGITVEGDLKQNLEGNTEVMGMKMPQKIETTIKISTK